MSYEKCHMEKEIGIKKRVDRSGFDVCLFSKWLISLHEGWAELFTVLHTCPHYCVGSIFYKWVCIYTQYWWVPYLIRKWAKKVCVLLFYSWIRNNTCNWVTGTSTFNNINCYFFMQPQLQLSSRGIFLQFFSLAPLASVHTIHCQRRMNNSHW